MVASNQIRLVDISKEEAFSDTTILEQRAQFSVVGVYGTPYIYSIYYHTEWKRPVIDVYTCDINEPGRCMKVDKEDATIRESLQRFMEEMSGLTTVRYTLQAWNDEEINQENYLDSTVEESVIAQFTMMTIAPQLERQVAAPSLVIDTDIQYID
jgi:hypothetical protein